MNNGEDKFRGLRLFDPDIYEHTTPEDRRLFFTIQLSVYLHYNKRGIRSRAERDMLEDLISVYWEEIEKSGILDGKTADEKIFICKEFQIFFPYTEIPDYLIKK